MSPLVLAAFLGAATTFAADPEFKPPVASPFGMGTVGTVSRPELIDLDGDLDLDVLAPALGSVPTGLAFFRNTGNSTNPAFLPGYSLSPFGLDNTAGAISTGFGDLNGDGDFDLILTSGVAPRNIYVCTNTGNSTNPAFAPKVLAPFGLTGTVAIIASPHLADIDGDSDLDLFMGSGANIAFRANTGNSTSPAFAAPVMNPFGIATVAGTNYWQPELADIDGDADKDMIVGNSAGNFFFFRNTGNSTNPQFSSPPVTNPFNFANLASYTSCSVRDFDGDGDLDALAGRGSGAFAFFKNSPVPKIPLGVVLLQPSTTDQENLEFSITFSEPVTTTFTTADFSLTGSLAAGATLFQDPTLSDPNYAFLVSLADPNADGTLGLSITGSVSDSQGELLVVPVNSPPYAIANFEAGDVNKDGAFDISDVALLADANLGLVTLP